DGYSVVLELQKTVRTRRPQDRRSEGLKGDICLCVKRRRVRESIGGQEAFCVLDGNPWLDVSAMSEDRNTTLTMVAQITPLAEQGAFAEEIANKGWMDERQAVRAPEPITRAGSVAALGSSLSRTCSAGAVQSLSCRERQISLMVAKGLSNKE